MSHKGPKPKPPEVRFWALVQKTDLCWRWTAGTKEGYGRFRTGGGGSKTTYAHRFAYELLVGPIPEGLHIDHLCRNRACVNPDHLEPVTPQENVRRGEGNGIKTHCPQGHAYTDENTYRDSLGRRYCRICKRTHRRASARRLTA